MMDKQDKLTDIMSKNHLKHNQYRLLKALMSSTSIKGACEKIGIKRGTYYKWIREDKAFNEALMVIREEELREGLNSLKTLVKGAVKALGDGLQCDEIYAKLKSANLILNYTLKAKETMDWRKDEILSVINEIVTLVISLFLTDIKKEERLKYNNLIEKFKLGLRAIVDKYLEGG